MQDFKDLAIEFLTRRARSNSIEDRELRTEARLLDLEWAMQALLEILARNAKS